MIESLLLAALQQPVPSSGPGVGVRNGFEPRPGAAEDLCAQFPASWKLPRVDRSGNALPNARFEQQVLRLIREPLSAASDAPASTVLMLGDLLARATAAARKPELADARKELQTVLTDARARVPSALWPQVEALLDIHSFLSPKWDPDDDERRSGFLTGESWELPQDCWPRHGGNRDVDQCAVFIAADLACIKIVECDFPGYFRYPDSNYLQVDAVPHSYCVELQPDCEPAAGLPRAARSAICVDMESDLPFPFGSFSFRLRMFSELNAEQRVITWVYSDSPDFHWMAGYDLYEPVFDSSGRFVGTIVMRQTGLDVDGVPDGSSHHRGGMRTILGGAKRVAERLWREREALGAFPGTGTIPVSPVVMPPLAG